MTERVTGMTESGRSAGPPAGPTVSDLQDGVRAAEDGLERAKADYARAAASTAARRSTTVAATEAPAA